MKLFVPFDVVKAEDDECIVEGYASTEALDSQGEIVTQKAMESALPDWLKFGNIREMHQPSAVGVAVSASHDGVGVRLRANIVDPTAKAKVKAGVYKGFSIGGKVTNRDKANKAIITGLHLTEISIVDRPANPEALFDVWKAEGAEPAAADEAAKGMYAVQELAQILTQIKWMAEDSKFEELMEGDTASTLPDGLQAWLRQGGELLGQMVTEEVAEMAPEADVAIIALADAAADLAKGGKRNSKADQKKLNDAHDALVTIGAECGGTAKHDASGDLQKANDELAGANGDLTKAHDDLAKASADLVEVTGKLTKAEGDLSEAQASVEAITKARDEATASIAELSKSLGAVTTERDDLAKRNETLAADLATLTTTADALKAEVETLKSKPEPIKGKLLAVGKGEDVDGSKPEATGAVNKSAEAVPDERWFSARSH